MARTADLAAASAMLSRLRPVLLPLPSMPPSVPASPSSTDFSCPAGGVVLVVWLAATRPVSFS